MQFLEEARFDPISAALGLCFLLSEQWWFMLIAFGSSMACIILGIFFGVVKASYETYCCYSHHPPPSAHFNYGGACNDPDALMYNEGDQAACLAWPLKV